MEDHLERVRSFYESNTNPFLRWGTGRETGVMHREVWAEGVKTRSEALRFPEHQIARAIASRREGPMSSGTVSVLDAGSGAGSSLLYLAGLCGAPGDTFVGCTVSPTQTKIARQKLQQITPEPVCSFYTSSYLDLPAHLTFDVIYGIESFVLGPDPGAFFSAMARHLRPGGYLILVDDFLIEDAPDSEYKQEIVAYFKNGWLAESLVSEAEANALAIRAGLALETTKDVTGALRLKRPRDYAIHLLYALGRDQFMRWDYTRALMGGHALQVALGNGWVGYFLKSWKKTG